MPSRAVKPRRCKSLGLGFPEIMPKTALQSGCLFQDKSGLGTFDQEGTGRQPRAFTKEQVMKERAIQKERAKVVGDGGKGKSAQKVGDGGKGKSAQEDSVIN
jgi:hypothetical protein